VPDADGRTIAELVDQLRHRSTVLGRWGFQRKLGKGPHHRAVLGRARHGKSMVAGLHRQGARPRINIKSIYLACFRKWIGETEKNLSKVSTPPRPATWVLLFDEADALLGRYHDVKSANDRYANIRNNYICNGLQRFTGGDLDVEPRVSRSIRPLSRRCRSSCVPLPARSSVPRILAAHDARRAAAGGRHRLSHVGARFELAGGHIRNIVLRAAYLAAARAPTRWPSRTSCAPRVRVSRPRHADGPRAASPNSVRMFLQGDHEFSEDRSESSVNRSSVNRISVFLIS